MDSVRLWTRVTLRVLLIFLLFGVGVWALYALRTVLLLLVLSVFFCYIVAPLVRAFEQPIYVGDREFKLPRTLAIAFVYLLVGGALFFSAQVLIPIVWQQVTELGKNLPDYISRAVVSLNNAFNSANSWVRHLRLPRPIRDDLLNQTSSIAESAVPWLQNIVGRALSYVKYLTWLVAIPFLSFFLLKDATRFESGLMSLVTNEKIRRRMHWFLRDVNRTMAAYIRAQILACLVVGALVTAGFGIIGVPYAIVLGLIAGVLEFIPLAGPLAAGAICFGLAMTNSLEMALWVAAFLVVLRIVQDYLIYPRIIGQGIKMHPLIVVVAILAGAEMAGLAGIFLAIPVVALLVVSVNHIMAYQAVRTAAGGAATALRQGKESEQAGEPTLEPATSPKEIERQLT